MADYDIEKAFRAIEDELMKSMIRNMKRHQAEEVKEKKQWSMWQADQLKSLEKYKRKNRKRFSGKISKIDKSIGEIISAAWEQGNMEQEIKILKAIQRGYRPHIIPPRIQEYLIQFQGKSLKEIAGILLKQNTVIGTTGEFFKMNDRKMNALIKATQKDFQKAERAVLRMAEDQYRQIIFNAQVYANSGAGTYEQAVDMATKDFLSRGINCIEYKNGARHTISDYAAMAIRTASKRAYLQGEGEKRQEWGITTVIMNKRGNACPKCLPFVGKVLVDDVWSGGKQSDGPYLLMSAAMAAGLYHPNCKDVHTTYFPGISTPGAAYTKEELKRIEEDYRKSQKEQYARRQADKYGRLAEYSLDEENKKRYTAKERLWKKATGNKHVISKEGMENLLIESENLEFKNRVKQEIQKLPQEQKDILNKNDIQFVMESGMNSYYHPLEKKIHLIPGFEDYECIHEIAHAIEDLTGVWDDKEFRQIIEEIALSHTAEDVIHDTANYVKPIYRIEDIRFISEYQGRIYEEGSILTENGIVNSDAMWDYFSEGYTCFIKNPSLLKERDRELYLYIERKLKNEDKRD